MTTKQYIAYYKISPHKGLLVQQGTVQHFIKRNKAKLMQEYVEENENEKLKEAIKVCCQQKATLIVAYAEVLSTKFEEILLIRKQVNNLLVSCDIPYIDRIRFEAGFYVLQKAKELHSTHIKIAMKKAKKNGQTFGSPQNLSPKSRKLGLEKMKQNRKKDKQRQKIISIVHRCKKARMGW